MIKYPKRVRWTKEGRDGRRGGRRFGGWMVEIVWWRVMEGGREESDRTGGREGDRRETV